jgi:response regulator RpfG family c-di-GMP phosphodiesterase
MIPKSAARARRWPSIATIAMTTICTILALLMFPVLFLLWLTESRQQRARRWRRDGLTYRAIAERLGCSQTTARRLVAA